MGEDVQLPRVTHQTNARDLHVDGGGEQTRSTVHLYKCRKGTESENER